MRQFQIVGRALPTDKVPEPPLFRMRVFARDPVLARSKYWYHMKRQHKIRKVQGEIVSTSEVSIHELLTLGRSSSKEPATSRTTESS
jgi:large subunit ribosomal protein L18Ae